MSTIVYEMYASSINGKYLALIFDMDQDSPVDKLAYQRFTEDLKMLAKTFINPPKCSYWVLVAHCLNGNNTKIFSIGKWKKDKKRRLNVNLKLIGRPIRLSNELLGKIAERLLKYCDSELIQDKDGEYFKTLSSDLDLQEVTCSAITTEYIEYKNGQWIKQEYR